MGGGFFQLIGQELPEAFRRGRQRAAARQEDGQMAFDGRRYQGPGCEVEGVQQRERLARLCGHAESAADHGQRRREE